MGGMGTIVAASERLVRTCAQSLRECAVMPCADSIQPQSVKRQPPERLEQGDVDVDRAARVYGHRKGIALVGERPYLLNEKKVSNDNVKFQDLIEVSQPLLLRGPITESGMIAVRPAA